MTDVNNEISGYSGNGFSFSEDGLDVDFSRAKLLNTTGTICDAYEYRQGTRRVFVKKLKARFQNSSRHRAALAKEYEIGASLSHPSLAVYRYAKNDYIVSDFIDGKTLASMLQSHDSWLESGENALKILRELTSVIGYLHDRNLVHSDIKADNVIITSGTHNAVLVDFDKCHSSSLDMVSGNPGIYGVKEEETGNPQIDFNGLARIAEKLSGIVKSSRYKKLLRRFIIMCGSPGVTTDKLLRCLQPVRKSNERRIWFTAAVLIAAATVFLIFFFTANRYQSASESKTAVEPQNIKTDSTTVDSAQSRANDIYQEKTEDITAPTKVKDEKPVNLKSLNQEIEQIYYPLYGEIEITLSYIKEQGGPDVFQAKEALHLLDNVNELQQEVWEKGFSLYWERYPQLDYKEAYEGYTKVPAFSKMVHSVDTVNNMLVPVVKAKAREARDRKFNNDM